MSTEKECPPHDWESGNWGVIIGVSKCKQCGKVSHSMDFPKWVTRTIFAMALLFVSLDTVHAKRIKLDPRLIRTDELTCLKLNLYHEARGEDLNGMMFVLDVVMARMVSPQYPNRVCKVVWQTHRCPRGRCGEFSWTTDNISDNLVTLGTWKYVSDVTTAYIESGAWKNIKPSILYYRVATGDPSVDCSPQNRDWFCRALNPEFKAGAHVFWKQK